MTNKNISKYKRSVLSDNNMKIVIPYLLINLVWNEGHLFLEVKLGIDKGNAYKFFQQVAP